MRGEVDSGTVCLDFVQSNTPKRACVAGYFVPGADKAERKGFGGEGALALYSSGDRAALLRLAPHPQTQL